MDKRIFNFLTPYMLIILWITIGQIILPACPDSVTATLIANCIVSCIGFYFYKITYFKRDREVKFDIKPFGIYLLFTVVIWFTVNVACEYAYVNFGDATFASYSDRYNSNIFIYLLLTVFVAPVFEELVIRGILYNISCEVFNRTMGTLVSVLVFSLLHGTSVHVILGIIAGIFFTFVYETRHNLLDCVIVHSIYNIMCLVFTIFLPVEPALWLFIVCLMISCVALLLYLLFMIKPDWTKFNKKEPMTHL